MRYEIRISNDYIARVKPIHYKLDGTPRFKTNPDGSPVDPRLLDWDRVDNRGNIVNDVSQASKKEGQSWWVTLLLGILYIFVHGAVRGEISKRKNNGNLPSMRFKG
jgi:hypothetical protein